MTAPYDPYNNISYLDINKRKYPDYDRDDSERLENRYQQPIVKKLYIKRNGDEATRKPKLYIWRQRATPTLEHLLEDLGSFMGYQESADSIYDVHGHKINHIDEVKDRSTYYVTDGDPLIFDEPPRRSETRTVQRAEIRHSPMSAPELESFSRNSLYADLKVVTPPPRPHSAQLPRRQKLKKIKAAARRKQMDEFERYYRAATRMSRSRVDDYDYRNPEYYYRGVPEESRARTSYETRRRDPIRNNGNSLKPSNNQSEAERYRSRSANDDPMDPRFTVSDFHDDGWEERDRYALEKHKEKNTFRQRSNSQTIYNRRDQTHPEAYLIYVFLNGQGMECQHVNFQKKQLEKGMNYVLELVARRYSVNPGRLCDMDGRRVNNVSDLMSRGAYVLVPVGQTFRDTWYFLPDNAIDTSSNRDRIEDRSNQRDRLLQRRERRNNIKTKATYSLFFDFNFLQKKGFKIIGKGRRRAI